MLGYDVEIFEANGEKTISTSYPNIYILLLIYRGKPSFQSHCSGSASIVYTCWDSGYTSIIIPAGFCVQVNESWKIRFPFPLFYFYFRQVLSRTHRLVTFSGGCGLTRSDGQRWESNYKNSETQSASFAAT